MRYLIFTILTIFSIICTGQEIPPSISKIECGELMINIEEEMPRFPGCENKGLTDNELQKCSQKKLLDYVYKNLDYTKTKECTTVSGRVIISFTVEKNGTLGSIKVARSPCSALGSAASAVFHKMNSDKLIWIPGKQRGRIVPVQYNFPIRFEPERN